MSSVLLTLDTKPPSLRVTASQRVEPPDDWHVEVVADEPLGNVWMVIHLSTGQQLPVGYERPDERSLSLRLPTVGIPGGPLRLRIVASDEACNTTVTEVSTAVMRPRDFDVVLDIGRPWKVTAVRSHAYDLEVAPGRTWEIEVVRAKAFAVEQEPGQTWEIDVSADKE